MRGAQQYRADGGAGTDGSGGHSLERDDAVGFLRATLPRDLSESERHDADVILETMCMGIADLYEGYSDFIEMEVQ